VSEGLRPTVLLGHPRYFRIAHGVNPHTRDPWGRRKVVERGRALAQWERFRQWLLDLGVQVLVLPPAPMHPGTVFPANAGFLVNGIVYLSRLNPARAGEREWYRRWFEQHAIPVADLPGLPYQWEGEADTCAVGDPSGDPGRTVYLFTHGRLERQRWTWRRGWPPYRRIYGFRTDARVLPAIQQVLAPHEVIPLELVDERYYHGDTCLCAFGPRREYLLAYLPALAPGARQQVRDRFGDRLLQLTEADAAVFAANAYQVDTPRPTLLIAHQVSAGLQAAIRQRGVEPSLVDVSEFLATGGGSVKCLLLHLGDRPHRT